MVDPTKSDKLALASEMRYVGIRLRNMRNAIKSQTRWAAASEKALLKAEDLLLDRAQKLDGIHVEA